MSARGEIHRQAEALGYVLIRSKRHLIWQHSQTGNIVVTAATPSDRRALRNIRTQLLAGLRARPPR